MDEAWCVALSGPLQLWPLSLLLYSRPELHWNTVCPTNSHTLTNLYITIRSGNGSIYPYNIKQFKKQFFIIYRNFSKQETIPRN